MTTTYRLPEGIEQVINELQMFLETEKGIALELKDNQAYNRIIALKLYLKSYSDYFEKRNKTELTKVSDSIASAIENLNKGGSII